MIGIQNYKILEKINAGSFGNILMGKNKRSGEIVAIKVEETTGGTIRNEVQMLQYLAHSGVKSIPPIYTYSVSAFIADTPQPILVMPFYKCNLYQYIKQTTASSKERDVKMAVTVKEMQVEMEPENPCTAYPFFHSILEIFESIHKHYVVHRDIKPQNFMMNEKMQWILIDFGLATYFVDEHFNHILDQPSYHIIGTPRFASFHIHCGHKYSRRDDLISLGYLFVWRMFHGTYLWDPTPTPPHPFLMESETYDRIDIRNKRNIELLKNKECSVFQQKCGLDRYSDRHPLVQYINYVYGLGFDESPNYEYMKSLFI